jgi:hypothetical protein
VQIVIPSKGRPAGIQMGALKLFPDALVCVGEDEVHHYEVATKNLLVHPPDVLGIGPLRQWILDHVEDPTVVMVDDDMHTVYAQTGFNKKRIEHPDTVRAIVERVAQCAKDAGARVFGFTQMGHPIDYRPMKPFGLNTWVGGLIGIHGRELRFDTTLKLRADIDYCLQSLVKDRIVWVDSRFCFIHQRFAGKGGNAINRSEERHRQEVEYLLRKWGPYLAVKQAKTTTKIQVRAAL